MADFRSIETFLWVVKLGSFRGAAQQLNTTQPAISQRIAQLEREMGVRLLNRDHRVVLADAERPADDGLCGEADRPALGDDGGGRRPLGDARRVAARRRRDHRAHLAAAADQERQSRPIPNLSLEIEVDITPNLRTRLLAQEIELAFVLGPLTAPASATAYCATIRSAFSPAPRSASATARLTVHDLAKFPIITFPRKTPPYEIVRSLFNRPELPPIRLHASASLATVIHMAIEGLGIAVIPTAIVENELADGRLQLLSTDLQIPPLTFSASWLASPDIVAVERVAELAATIAQGGVVVDAPLSPRH